MPEQCQFCFEIAVIKDVVDGGEMLICIECGSLATGLVSKDSDLDSDLEEETDTQTQTNIGDINVACKLCGIGLEDLENQQISLCPSCFSKNTDKNEETVSIYPETASNDANNSKTVGKTDPVIRCASCNSTNLSQESINGDERLICSDCGCVNSDVVLTNNAFGSSTQSNFNHFTTLPRFSQRKQLQRGLLAGLEKIRFLCSKYCFSTEIRMESEEMFKNLCNQSRVLHSRISTKQNIAAVCLFIVCRQNNFPISLTLFRNDVDVFKLYLRATRLVLKILDIKLPHMSFTNQLITFLIYCGYGSEICAKVKDILFLYRRAWLTDGRCRQDLITIATYYAFSSSSKCNKYITLNQFCKQIKVPKLSRRLARECEIFLLKLAHSLPWVGQRKVTAKTLHLYIDDIVKYQESLFHLIFKSEEDGNVTLLDQEQNEILHSSTEIPSKQKGLKRKETLVPSVVKKRQVIGDTAVQHSFLVPLGINLDAPELQENEFEEEINSYIFSSDEEASVREHKISLWEK